MNKREDFLHKLSKRIVNDNQVIILEDLHVKGLLKNEYLSKSISDVSWNTFIRYLQYKALWYGKQVVFADRYYPSSKTCSVCGYKKENLTLRDRYWTCPVCGAKHDRDINAGKNLLLYGAAHLTSGRAGTARSYACGGAKSFVEAGSPSIN
ncbi:RNA-guided endonuclease TnpB family protein [Hydrogenobacter thermophilus]|uniref:RNA-guided endonuclease TnpB family protein n=1 Tax=Hydrogenobacter thermophilus TaxID=940 RepID=UPI0030FAC8DA